METLEGIISVVITIAVLIVIGYLAKFLRTKVNFIRIGDELHLRADVRFRGVLGRAEALAGSELGVQFRDLSVQPYEVALQGQ